jgi:AmmeMemoRadiSam system protein B
MPQNAEYRKAGVAGSFYSRDKLILERELSMLLEAPQVINLPRKIKALIVPHAGYLYSGGVAARAYSQILNSDYRKVVVIAPSHEDSFNFCSIYNGLGYQTPLGTVPLDESVSQRLVDSSPGIRFSDLGHSSSEHALEVQLPFLQWSLGKFKLIPISMGEQNEDLMRTLSQSLAKILPHDQTLIVASSDLSHMYFDHQARRLDKVAVKAINDFDEESLWEEVRAGHTEMCGFGPVIAAMKTARQMGAKEARVLLYRNSGDITGDLDAVVGYLSAIIY